jgi:NACalpha-BTF3-like transcription factor
MAFGAPILLVPFGPLVLSFPPSDIWMAYLYILALHFILRGLLLWGPYEGLLSKYGKEGKNLWKQLWRIVKATGLKGVYGLIISEIFLLILPSIFALSIRLLFGPPTSPWPTSQNLLLAYIILFACWSLFEIRDIIKTRKSVNTVLHSSNIINTLKLHPSVMKNMMKTFGWGREQLEGLSKMDIVNSPTETEIEPDDVGIGKKIKNALKLAPQAMAVRKVTKETAKIAATKIDEKAQKEFDSILESIHSWKRVGKGLALNMMPLIILYVTAYLF